MLWTTSILVLLPAVAWGLNSNSVVAAFDLKSRQAQDTQPQCVQSCIEQILPTYNCNVDETCFCGDRGVTTAYKTCVQTNCTLVQDQITGQRYQAETCDDPSRNQSTTIQGVTWAFFALAVIFVAVRLLSRSRSFQGSGYSWDDYVVIFCFAMIIPLDVSLDQESRLGLGQDMWFVDVASVRDVLRWFYVGEILYNSIVMLTKVAIVLLYLRIWTADSITKGFRVACWIIIGVLVATMLAFDFGIIFQCDPINFAWTWVLGGQGSCIQVEPMVYTFGALNILYDIVVFVLPIHSLLKLQIAWPKKIAICTVFIIGFVVTICSIIRLQYLVRMDMRTNITWDYHYIALWGIIEANLSLICTCAPSVVGFAQRWMNGGIREADDDDWVNGSVTRQIIIRGPHDPDDGSGNAAPSEMSHNRLGDVETALRRGQENGSRYSESIPDKVGDNVSMTDSASDLLRRGRAGEKNGAPQDATALMYRPRSESSNRVEISHEPPTQPAEAHLSYRDENDIYHEVIVTDIPHGKYGPMHPSRSRMRPSNLRALTETDGGDEPLNRGSGHASGSQSTSMRSSDPQNQGVVLPSHMSSPPRSPMKSLSPPGVRSPDNGRSLSPPVSQLAESIDGGVASGRWSRPTSFAHRPTSQIARTPSLASATWEAAEVASKTPSPPWHSSPHRSGSAHSIATQTEDTELSPVPSATLKPASQEVLFTPRSLTPHGMRHQSMMTPSAGTQTDDDLSPPPPMPTKPKTSSVDNGIQVSPMQSRPPFDTGRWEWPSDPEDVESPRGRSPMRLVSPPPSADVAVQATSLPRMQEETLSNDTYSPGFRSDMNPNYMLPPDQYTGEPGVPFAQSQGTMRSPTRSPVPLTNETTDAMTTSEEVQFRGRSPPRNLSMAPAPRSASSAALRNPPALPGMVDAGNQTDEEEDFIDDRPQTLSPPRGREQMPSLSPTVSQLDVPAQSRNFEMDGRRESRSPLPGYPPEWHDDPPRSRPMSGDMFLPSTTFNPNWSRDSLPRQSPGPSGFRSPEPMFWDDRAIKEDISNAFNEPYHRHENNWRNQSPPRFLSPLPEPDFQNKGPRTASSQAVPMYNNRIERQRSPSPTAWQAGIPPEPEYYQQPEESPFQPYDWDPGFRAPSPTALMSGILPPYGHGREFRSPSLPPSRDRSRPDMGRRMRSRSLVPSRSPPQERMLSYGSAGSAENGTQTSPDDEYPPMEARNSSTQTDGPSFPSPDGERPLSQEIVIRPSLSPLQPMDRLRQTPPHSKHPSPQNTVDYHDVTRSPAQSRSPPARTRSHSVEAGAQTDSDWENHMDEPLGRARPKSRSPPREDARSHSVDVGAQTDPDWEDHLDEPLNRSRPQARSPPAEDTRSHSVEHGAQTDSDWEEHLDKPLAAPRSSSFGPENNSSTQVNMRSSSAPLSPYPLPPHGYELEARREGRGRSPPLPIETYPSPHTGAPRLPSMDPNEFNLDRLPPPRRDFLVDGKYMDDEGGYVADRDDTPDGYYAGLAGLRIRSSPSPAREPESESEDEWQPPRPGHDFEIPRIPSPLLAQLADASSSKMFEDTRSPSPPLNPTMMGMVDEPTYGGYDDSRSSSPRLQPSASFLSLPYSARLQESRPPSPEELAQGLSGNTSAELSPADEKVHVDFPSHPHSPEPYEAQLAALNDRSPGDSRLASPGVFGDRSPSPSSLAQRLAEATAYPQQAGTPDSENDQTLPNWGATPWSQPVSPSIDDAQPLASPSPNESPMASPPFEGVSIHRGDSYHGPPPEQFTAGTEMNTPGSEFIPTRPVSQMNVPTLGQIEAGESLEVATLSERQSRPASLDVSPGMLLSNSRINELLSDISRSPSPPVERMASPGVGSPASQDAPRTGELADTSRSPSPSPILEPTAGDSTSPGLLAPGLGLLDLPSDGEHSDMERSPSPPASPVQRLKRVLEGSPPGTPDFDNGVITMPQLFDESRSPISEDGEEFALPEVQNEESVRSPGFDSSLSPVPRVEEIESIQQDSPAVPQAKTDMESKEDGFSLAQLPFPVQQAVKLIRPSASFERATADGFNTEVVNNTEAPSTADDSEQQVEEVNDTGFVAESDVPNSGLAVDALWSPPSEVSSPAPESRPAAVRSGSTQSGASDQASEKSMRTNSGSIPSLSKSLSGSPAPSAVHETPGTPDSENYVARPVSQLNVPTLKTLEESPRTPDPEVKELDLPQHFIDNETAEVEPQSPGTRHTSMYFSPLSTPLPQESKISTPNFFSAVTSPVADESGTTTPTGAKEFPGLTGSLSRPTVSPASSWLGLPQNDRK